MNNIAHITPPNLSNIKSLVLTLPEYSSRLPKLDKLLQNFEKIGLNPELFNGVHGKDIVINSDIKNEMETITWRDITYNYNINSVIYGNTGFSTLANSLYYFYIVPGASFQRNMRLIIHSLLMMIFLIIPYSLKTNENNNIDYDYLKKKKTSNLFFTTLGAFPLIAS